jgi:hypothetical protein
MTTTIRAVIIPAEPDQPARVSMIEPTATTYQGIVGGWIQGIGGDGWSAYVNEEGKLMGQSVNVAANNILAALGWVGAGRDFVVGPVVIVGPPNAKHDDTDLPDDILARIVAPAN